MTRALREEEGVSRWLLAASLPVGLLVWVLAGFLVWPQAGRAVTLEDLRFVSVAVGMRVELLLDGAAQYRVFTLADPLRVVIDLDDTSAPSAPRRAVNNGPVLGVRSARQGKGLRVVIDLARQVEVSDVMKSPGKGRYYRLVIGLGLPVEGAGKVAGRVAGKVKGKRSAAASAGALKLDLPGRRGRHFSARSAPGMAVSQASVPGSEAGASSVGGKAVPTAMSEPDLRDFVVAVDAGHGGKDPGARGRRGTLEKRVVLAIAKRLKHELDAVPGVRAVLIRSGDRYVDLRGRMQRARKQRADMFVSIHADAFRKSSASGASVFVLSRKGATSESARWLAKQENAPFLAGGVVLVDKDDDLRQTLLDMSQTASHEAGFGVAKAVLARLGKVTRLHAGRVERAGFLVLKSPDIPSILVETGFLSNPREERKLRDPAHQKKLARAIRDGLLAYFSTNPPAGTLLAGRKYIIKRGDTLSAIAQTFSVSLRRLRRVNGIKGDLLRVGQVLRIPPAAIDG